MAYILRKWWHHYLCPSGNAIILPESGGSLNSSADEMVAQSENISQRTECGAIFPLPLPPCLTGQARPLLPAGHVGENDLKICLRLCTLMANYVFLQRDMRQTAMNENITKKQVNRSLFTTVAIHCPGAGQTHIDQRDRPGKDRQRSKTRPTSSPIYHITDLKNSRKKPGKGFEQHTFNPPAARQQAKKTCLQEASKPKRSIPALLPPLIATWKKRSETVASGRTSGTV